MAHASIRRNSAERVQRPVQSTQKFSQVTPNQQVQESVIADVLEGHREFRHGLETLLYSDGTRSKW
jgi:hypothetical protein